MEKEIARKIISRIYRRYFSMIHDEAYNEEGIDWNAEFEFLDKLAKEFGVDNLYDLSL